MGFTLGSVAVQGLPAGQYVLRIEDIEAGVSGTKNDKIQFTGVVAHSDNPEVRVGTKEVWSYTYAKQYISILASDLVRAGLPKDLTLDGIAANDAKIFAQYMRGNHYLVNVVQQKKDPTRTNTSFIGAYNPGGLPAQSSPAPIAQVSAPAPIAAAPVIPFAQAQAPAPAQAAWGNPPPAAAQAPNPFNQAGVTHAPNPMPSFGAPLAAQQAPAAAPFIAPVNAAPAPQAFAPAPVAQAPAPAAQASAIPAAQATDAPLNPEIITALQNGQRPYLNGKQLAQIKQVGWDAVYAEYEALFRAQQGQQTQAAAPQAQDPAQALLAAFATV